MSPGDRSWLLEVTDEMKRRGVRKFDVPGVLAVEFGAADAPLTKDAGAAVDNEMCQCGCPVSGHMGGMCVTAGCSPEKCAEKK